MGFVQVEDRRFPLWRHLTSSTRILHFFCFLCLLEQLFFKPNWKFKIEITIRKNERNSGGCS